MSAEGAPSDAFTTGRGKRPGAWVRHLYRNDVGAFAAGQAHAEAPRRNAPVGPRRVTGDRATATYAAHPYWSKKPYELLLACVELFTRPGDLVLDPFAGSGGLPLLASRLGRPAIARDRSAAAVFITDGLSRLTSDIEVRAEMRGVVEAAGVDQMYATRCHRCGGVAETQYAVWCDVLWCPACGREYARERGRSVSCPFCHGRSRGRPRRVGERLTEIAAVCRAGCVPARFRRGGGQGNPAARSVWNRYDLPSALRTRRGVARLPRKPIPAGLKTAEALARGIRRVDQMFTPRNAVAMARVRDAIKRDGSEASAALRLAWHAALIGTSLKAQHAAGGGGYLPGMYYVPPVRKERNVAVTLDRIASRLTKAARSYPSEKPPAPLHASIGDARDLTPIPDGVVDYVFLDPPYDAKIQYAELNLLWEAWLDVADDWRDDDLVVNRARAKDIDAWQRDMGRVIRECARVMKRGGWLSITYVPGARDSLPRLLEAFATAGFQHRAAFDGAIENHQRTFVQRTSGSTRTDRIMHFQLAR